MNADQLPGAPLMTTRRPKTLKRYCGIVLRSRAREPPVPVALDTRARLLVTRGPRPTRLVPSGERREVRLDPVQTRRGGLQTGARIEAQQCCLLREGILEQGLHAFRSGLIRVPSGEVREKVHVRARYGFVIAAGRRVHDAI